MVGRRTAGHLPGGNWTLAAMADLMTDRAERALLLARSTLSGCANTKRGQAEERYSSVRTGKTPDRFSSSPTTRRWRVRPRAGCSLVTSRPRDYFRGSSRPEGPSATCYPRGCWLAGPGAKKLEVQMVVQHPLERAAQILQFDALRLPEATPPRSRLTHKITYVAWRGLKGSASVRVNGGEPRGTRLRLSRRNRSAVASRPSRE